jgi:predicted nucleic acid-binding protein
MTKVLVDINVVLDVLLDRRPHATASVAVWAAIEGGRAQGLLAAHAVTTIYYLIHEELGGARTRQAMGALLRVFDVATVDRTVIREALQSSLSDFEDSVSASAARLAGCDLIVTRDARGFRGAPVPALTPEAAAPLLASA